MKNLKLFFVVALCCGMVLAWAGQACAWWNESWEYRKKIDLDPSPTGANINSPVSDVPVLIRLHPGNFDFTVAKDDGSDIRFVSGDDTKLLKYHIESYDSLEELALVWVMVPKITPGAINSIYVYYGNEEAAQASDSAGTFDTGQAFVFHFDEFEGVPKDSSAYKNNAAEFTGGQGLPAIIGKGISFYGAQDKMVIAASPSTKTNQGFTFSTWLRLNQGLTFAPLLTKKDGAGELQIVIDGMSVQASMKVGAKTIETGFGGGLQPEKWHHLAVSGNGGGDLQVFIDGVSVAQAKLPRELPEMEGDLIIGGGDENGAFFGELDELRFSTIARPADWLMASARSQAPESVVASLGVEEVSEGGGLPISYLSTVAKNISLDGWLIISLLLVLGLCSGMVLVGKAYFLYLNNKDNRAFLKAFNGHGGLFCLDGEYADFGNSPLHRVYRGGCKTLTDIFGGKPDNGEKTKLSHKEMNSFKASLEKGYVFETKNFNAWLVVMTLAISGGPFLGLLGTVWGVMNTFAAMAEAGEANIMAIAPGVASALATTVFGLCVAIPALFGYNYLIGKIKDLTADLNVFVDEFTLIVDEYHGGE